MSLSQRLNLSIFLPPKITIEAVCAAIKTEGTTVASFNSREIRSTEVNKLIAALKDKSASKSLLKLELIAAFPFKEQDRYDDQVKIFDAVKYMLKELVLDQNVLSKRFLQYINQQKKADSKIAIEVTCANCTAPSNESISDEALEYKTEVHTPT